MKPQFSEQFFHDLQATWEAIGPDLPTQFAEQLTPERLMELVADSSHLATFGSEASAREFRAATREFGCARVIEYLAAQHPLGY